MFDKKETKESIALNWINTMAAGTIHFCVIMSAVDFSCIQKLGINLDSGPQPAESVVEILAAS